MTNEELTAIYNEANGLDPKRHNPITTERIFSAMRAAMIVESEKWRASLTDTTDFMERHSNRWDGSAGKHPMEVVEVARELLRSNASLSGLPLGKD